MRYLLDVNALLALGFEAHSHHGDVARWVSGLRSDDRIATCAITELGFVRIAPQARLAANTGVAQAILEHLRTGGVRRLVRITDDLGADSLPAWVRIPSQVTDGHLVALAVARRARLVTLDRGIADAVLIPTS